MLSTCLLCACTARSAQPQTQPVTEPIVQQQVEPTPQPEPEPAELPPSRATLLAVGDNLIHDVIYWQAQARAADGGYDFLPVYSAVSQEIADADLAFINQETPITASRLPSSYPLFNSPPQLAQNLAALGFDIVNPANNHMLDQGIEGLTETEQALRENNIPAITGTDGAVPVLEREGISFSFTGFTEHTNGILLPQGQEEKITYTDQPERMQQQVKEAAQIADVAVVSVHWGQENSTTPTPAQRELAQQLADWGADIIIGTHPHVLQPVEQLTAADGRQVWVLYSLGNFVSAQADRPNLVGADGRDCRREGRCQRGNFHLCPAACLHRHHVWPRLQRPASGTAFRLHRSACRPARGGRLLRTAADPGLYRGAAWLHLPTAKRIEKRRKAFLLSASFSVYSAKEILTSPMPPSTVIDRSLPSLVLYSPPRNPSTSIPSTESEPMPTSKS